MRSAVAVALLASAQALMVNVTCANAPTSYTVNGVENANLTVTAGERIWFDIDCATDAFQITDSTNNAITTGINPTTPVTVGMIELNTTATTPATLKYSSTTTTAMMGWIKVNPAPVKASTPTITSVVASQTSAELNITWSAGSAGDCMFDHWQVLFVSGGTVGGVVPGCDNLTDVAVVSCKATSLSQTTSYTFTVQRVCSNDAANSNISITSAAGTTISLAGIKVCQNVDTCNCGNATSCVCQLTRICNCDTAATCTCQGGTCNGGHAGRLICGGVVSGCNKQCAKNCDTCLGDTITGFFGSNSCSDAGVIHASIALVAALFAFSW